LFRSYTTDARYSQGAQGTDKEHLRAGSRQTAMGHGRNTRISVLDRREEHASGMRRFSVVRNKEGDVYFFV
jgi:hypothetical protein